MSSVENESEVDPMRARYEELAELAGSLAHEIKNPLSVIHMNIDLLSEDLVELDSHGSRRSLERVDIVRGQCERMEGLLRDFLKYTRLRDIDCLLKKFDLLWIFDHAKLLQRHRHPLIIVQWVKILTPTNEATITSFYDLRGRYIFVGV